MVHMDVQYSEFMEAKLERSHDGEWDSLILP